MATLDDEHVRTLGFVSELTANSTDGFHVGVDSRLSRQRPARYARIANQ